MAVVREPDPLAAHDEGPAMSLPVAVPESPVALSPTADRSPPEAALPETATLRRRCAACQHIQSGAARFCSACGAPFGRICGNCGEAVAHAVTFCPACGQHLTEGSPATPSPPVALPLPRLPLSTLPSSAGEHKLITVLCGVIPHVSA